MFDTVLHGILVDNLLRHGPEKWTVRWVKNWLDLQTQRIVISRIESK